MITTELGTIEGYKLKSGNWEIRLEPIKAEYTYPLFKIASEKVKEKFGMEHSILIQTGKSKKHGYNVPCFIAYEKEAE